MPSSEPRRAALVGLLSAAALVALGRDARAQSAPPADVPSAPAPPAPLPPASATPGATAAATPGATWMSAGATLFAASYMASALTATTDYYTVAATGSKRTDLWVPVFGPIDQMGKTKSAGLDVLLVLDALAELGGLTIFGYGVAERMSRPAGAPPARAPVAPSAAIRPVLRFAAFPVSGATGAALAATF